MNNRFSGDPKLYLTADGATMQFQGGQPVMDKGFENVAFISLFTAPGWWGNSLTTEAEAQIGSNFEERARGAITLQKLRDIEKDAARALENPAFGRVSATARNVTGAIVNVTARIEPPGQDSRELLLTRNGQNWLNQAEQGE